MLIHVFLQRFPCKLGNYWFDYYCLTYGAGSLVPFTSFILIWWVMMQKWVTHLFEVDCRRVHVHYWKERLTSKLTVLPVLHFYFKVQCHVSVPVPSTSNSGRSSRPKPSQLNCTYDSLLKKDRHIPNMCKVYCFNKILISPLIWVLTLGYC